MKHRKILSALLALVMVMALTVPALAEEAVMPPDPDIIPLDELEFSVAPAGIATITAQKELWDPWNDLSLGWETEIHTVYVFDTDQPVSAKLKSGEEFEAAYLVNYKYEPDTDQSKPDLKRTQTYVIDMPEMEEWPSLFDYSIGGLAHMMEGDELTFGVGIDFPGWMGVYGKVFHVATKAHIDELIATGTACVEYKPLSAGTGTYTVKKWDTWGQIALNNYGTYSRAVWTALKNANKGVSLKEGATLTLPEKIGNYTRLAPQVLAEGEKFYTVKAGDTLGQIAAATYKDISMYKAIFERNSDRLKNANSIYEGQILVLPAKPAK